MINMLMETGFHQRNYVQILENRLKSI